LFTIAVERSKYKHREKEHKKRSSFEILKYDDATIVLIEDYPCKSRNALFARERYWYDLNKEICVNITKPICTAEERELKKQKLRKIDIE